MLLVSVKMSTISEIKTLIKAITTLSNSLPQSVQQGTKEDKIWSVMHTEEWETAHKTFNRHFDAMFGEDCWDASGCLQYVHKRRLGLGCVCSYLSGIDWADNFSLDIVEIKLQWLIRELKHFQYVFTHFQPFCLMADMHLAVLMLIQLSKHDRHATLCRPQSWLMQTMPHSPNSLSNAKQWPAQTAYVLVLFTFQIKFWIAPTAAKKWCITLGATSTLQRKRTITSDEDTSGEDEVDDDQRSTTGALIGPPTGPSSKNTLYDASYGHSHHSHFRKHTPNTHGHLQTSIFDSEHFSATSNVSEVFHNTPNACGRSHPTPPTFGHISRIFPTRIHSSSNILDTCLQHSAQVPKEQGVSRYFVIYYNKGQFDLDILSSYYIIIFWSHSSSHIVSYFLFDVDMFS
jgi:hypothetical protein